MPNHTTNKIEMVFEIYNPKEKEVNISISKQRVLIAKECVNLMGLEDYLKIVYDKKNNKLHLTNCNVDYEYKVHVTSYEKGYKCINNRHLVRWICDIAKVKLVSNKSIKFFAKLESDSNNIIVDFRR